MRPFLLLRPRLLGVKNTLFSRRSIRRRSQREIVFSLVSLLLIFCVFQAACTTFDTVRQHAPQYGVQPDLPISLFFSLLSGMILLSGSAAALGAFYLGHDLDFLIAKPITPLQFLLGKGAETIFQSSWMVLVFGIPTLVGIGHAYQMSIAFYLLALMAIIPVLTIPTFVGISIISLIIRVVPPQKMREVLFVGASIMILYIYLTAKNFMVDGPSTNPAEIGESLHQLIRISSSPWLPSAWAAQMLGAYLSNPVLDASVFSTLAYLYTASLICAGTAYLTLRSCHFDAFSSARSNARSTRISSARGQRRLNRTLFFLAAPARSLCAKEMKLFGRDLTQGLQLIMLLGICLVYLYNFKIVHQVGNIKPEVLLWWKSTLLICNLGMGAFIITAVSSRFVFPCISLEGNAFWIIRSAPLALSSVLRSKFWIWYIPVACISSIVLISGAMAIDAEPQIVAITGMLSWVLCFGLVSLGIGLGSYFAHFDWESAPQIASSFGNLVYMISGTVLIFINLIPITIMTVIATLRESGVRISDLNWNFAIFSTAAALFYINYLTYRFSLRLGEDALNRKS